MQPFIRTVRAAAWAALWMLMPGQLWAQGTSPWVEAVNELQAQFTGPIARGLSLIAIVVGGLMFAFGDRSRSAPIDGAFGEGRRGVCHATGGAIQQLAYRTGYL